MPIKMCYELSMGSVVSCLTDNRRIEGHVALLRLAIRRVGFHHRKADNMPFNFSGPGGELVIAPEGFMGNQGLSPSRFKSTEYLVTQVIRRRKTESDPCRDTFKSMDNPLIPVPIEKPRRLRPDVERFFADFIRRQDSMARMFWEYICRNDERMDRFEEALMRRP